MATEKRLIDANELISAIDEYMKNAYDCPLDEVADFQRCSNDVKTIYAVEGLYEATEIIAEAPTVDTVEVVHGHWKKLTTGGYDFFGSPTIVTLACNCSVCGLDGREETNYCSNCGAKMDGDRNG